jgi:hypothetical protein
MTATSYKRSALQGLARSKAARWQHDEEDAAQVTELEAEIQAVVSDLGGVGSDEEFDVRMSGKGKRAKERPIKVRVRDSNNVLLPFDRSVSSVSQGLTKKDKLETERMQREIRQRQYEVFCTYDTDITLKRQSTRVHRETCQHGNVLHRGAYNA